MDYLTRNENLQYLDSTRDCLVWDTRLRFYPEMNYVYICCNYMELIIQNLNLDNLLNNSKSFLGNKKLKQYKELLLKLPLSFFQTMKSFETLLEYQKYDDCLALLRKSLEKLHFLFVTIKKIQQEDKEYVDKYLFYHIDKLKQSILVSETREFEDILISVISKESVALKYYSKFNKNIHVDFDSCRQMNMNDFHVENLNFYYVYKNFLIIFSYFIDIVLLNYGLRNFTKSNNLTNFMDILVAQEFSSIEKTNKIKIEKFTSETFSQLKKVLDKHMTLINLQENEIREYQVLSLKPLLENNLEGKKRLEENRKKFTSFIRNKDSKLLLVHRKQILYIYERYDFMSIYYSDFFNISYKSSSNCYNISLDKINKQLSYSNYLKNVEELDRLNELNSLFDGLQKMRFLQVTNSPNIASFQNDCIGKCILDIGEISKLEIPFFGILN